MPWIFTSIRSSAPFGTPSLLNTTLSYRVPYRHTRDVGFMLSPVYYRRNDSRLVSCYALFK